MKSRNQTNKSAFTLVELCVLVVLVSVLILTLLPALAGARTNSKAAQCLNNLRRLTGAWQMYASDNADQLVGHPTWVAGAMDWNTSPDNTNSAKLIDPAQSSIARYVRAADLFKCPADNYVSPAQRFANFPNRVRSVSLNAALGGSLVINQGIPGRTYFAPRKVTELNKPGPASTMVMLDEHPDSINDAGFFVAEAYLVSTAQWIDLPAGYHERGAGISFADGSVMVKRWVDNRTSPPVNYFPPNLPLPTPGNPDYVWLIDRVPYR